MCDFLLDIVNAWVNKDRTSCEFHYPSITSVLTTLEAYGTSLDLVLWRVLASSRKYLRDFVRVCRVYKCCVVLCCVVLCCVVLSSSG